MVDFYKKWSKIWPTVFYGIFVSLLAFLIFSGFFVEETSFVQEFDEELSQIYPEPDPLFGELISFDRPFGNYEQDMVLVAYEDSANHDWIESFFESITGCRDIALVILENAVEFNVSPSLAFSLSWEESRYNPQAVNRSNSNKTIDRGLFQLNSASFPELKEQEFFDLQINAQHGLSYLRWCLDIAGTEVAGLAMYNAGHNRVHTGGTPKMTLDYIDRIINRQRRIDENFLSEYTSMMPVIAEYSKEMSMIVEVSDLIVPEYTLSLRPLGRR